MEADYNDFDQSDISGCDSFAIPGHDEKTILKNIKNERNAETEYQLFQTEPAGGLELSIAPLIQNENSSHEEIVNKDEDRNTLESESDHLIKCPVCILNFENFRVLRLHLKTVHFVTKSCPNETFSCSVCKKTFKYKFSWIYHLENVHVNQPRVKCPKCPKDFKNQPSVRRHAWSSHYFKIKGAIH